MNLFYFILSIQEKLHYISTITELLNIFSVLTVVMGINLFPAFYQVLGALNSIYLLYMFLILFLAKGEFKKVSLILLPLIILRSLNFVRLPITSLVFSIFSIATLFKFHMFLYIIGDNPETKN